MKQVKSSLVSIIITTKNEAKVIERLLVSLTKQTYPKIEIIVVDNFSTDQTVEIAKKFTKQVYDFGPERSTQRNFGVKKAKGDYILILDADMSLAPSVVGDCVEQIQSDADLGGVVIPEQSVATTFWERVKAFERSFYNAKGDSVTDAARFFKRTVFDQVGGYDETITGPEDWDLPERVIEAGYKIGRIKSVIKHYERVPNPIILARKKYYYALTAHRYLKRHAINPISAKTIYFLRPVFYQQPGRLIGQPLMTIGLIAMFSCELVGGGLGYLVGKIKQL